MSDTEQPEESAPPSKRPMNRLQKGGSALVILASTTIGGYEGLQQYAYPDPATRGPPWTICYGDTYHVTPHEKDSLVQCKARLLKSLDKESTQVDKCLHARMGNARYVAVLSIAYNIGVGAFCRSSIVRDLDAGRDVQGCNDFMKYDRAAGFVMRGLVTRRQEERRLCMEG